MLRRATFDANLSYSSSVFGKVQAEHEDEYDDEDDSEGNLTNVQSRQARTVH